MSLAGDGNRDLIDSQYAALLNRHYGRQDLAGAILDGLRAAGKDPDRLTYTDLGALDQFHIGGKDATLRLARLAGFRPGLRVLDVGGGLGGPARTLTAEFDCRVTVLDLTEEYCRVGEMLTARTGLSDRVDFKNGNALEIPFADGGFDLVWTQHSSMNIADKERLYAEIRRVARSGGRLALHEIMAGPVQPVHFPVPWASSASISFLRPAQAMRTLIGDSGFREVSWVDASEQSLEWFRRPLSAMAAGTLPPLGLHLLLGEAFVPAFRNQVRNLEERRITVIEAIFERA